MLLWISFAVLTAAAFAVVLRPAFINSRTADKSRTAPDLAVYRDQLAELDRQLAAAQLGPAEHDALRVEVSRRILRLEGEGTKPSSRTSSGASKGAPSLILALATLAPLAALGLYLNLGAPAIPAQPFATIAAPAATTPAATLIAQVEARLAANPSDGRGWDVIAPVYFKLERFADAAQAYQRAIALQGETVPRLAGLAEATVLSNDGIVTEPARAAYEKLSRLAPDRIEPRFWLALAKEQDGQRRCRISRAARDISARRFNTRTDRAAPRRRYLCATTAIAWSHRRRCRCRFQPGRDRPQRHDQPNGGQPRRTAQNK
jgi:cytochrome c-type biogenesis protein CcmH